MNMLVIAMPCQSNYVTIEQTNKEKFHHHILIVQQAHSAPCIQSQLLMYTCCFIETSELIIGKSFLLCTLNITIHFSRI